MNNKKIVIGEYDEFCVDLIDIFGLEIWGFLIRKGNWFFLELIGNVEIYFNGKKVLSCILIFSF